MNEVAIVHDYLTQRGGAERVVLLMQKAFPAAPIYTSLFSPAATFPEFRDLDVRAAGINRIRFAREHHRATLPVLAGVFSRMRPVADFLLCSSSGWAHGVGGGLPRLVYCYTPARWLYLSEEYLGSGGGAPRLALRALRGPLMDWDRRAAHRARRYVTTSTTVRERIRRIYDLDADVLAPPPSLGRARPVPVAGVNPGYHLCVSRLLPYKNVAAVVAAFQRSPEEWLIVVGDGPDRAALMRSAPPNVTFLPRVTDGQLAWLYENCHALIGASFEDYGLTPLEAASFGRPSLVLRGGGFLDTVVEGTTGLFFDAPTSLAIRGAINSGRHQRWRRDVLMDHAASFSENRFVDRLREMVFAEMARARVQ